MTRREHTAPLLAFLPSPLLGPASWEPVSHILSGSGWRTVVCPVAAPARTGQAVLDAFLAALRVDGDIVLVAHSNAGAYIPALMARRPVVAGLFVDAVLPAGHGPMSLAPPEFLALLREIAADDGMLPPWTQWWDEMEVASLFADAWTRARIEREQQRLPLSYFEGALPVPSGWIDRPGAYLSFGDTYADERDRALALGWPVDALEARHLHLVVNPQEVADHLGGLLGRLGIGPPGI